MPPVSRLLANYRRFVGLPWVSGLAGKQRVWLAVYPPAEERRVRAQLTDFANATIDAKHGWQLVDVTRVFPEWLASQKYRDRYFANPELLDARGPIESLVTQQLAAACEACDENSVVAVQGAGSLFDFIRISSVLDAVESSIRGRLLVFFPGERQQNIYRFMDARDGFNYMATPITCSENFLAP